MAATGVHLRPFEEPDLVLFDRAGRDRDFSFPFEWAGFTSSQPMRRRWEEDGLLDKSPFLLAVAHPDSDLAVGDVMWRETERAGPATWEIGILLAPEWRGRGIGSEAQRLLVEHLFATTPTQRVWAGTEVENVAEQRALERAGLRQEGLLRSIHYRDGLWRDAYVYGIIRADLEAPSTPPFSVGPRSSSRLPDLPGSG